MKITSIQFTKTLQTDAYTWHKVGLQADLEENDNIQESIKKLESDVNQYFKEVLKPKPIPEKVIPQIKLSTADALIRDINTCTELKVLGSYKLLSQKYPTVKEAYESKYSQLKQ